MSTQIQIYLLCYTPCIYSLFTPWVPLVSSLCCFHLDILWKLLTYWIFRLITELFPVNFWQLPSQFLTRVLVKVRYKCCLEMKGASAPVIIGKLLTLELCFLCCGSHHQEGPFTLPLSPLHSVFVVSGGWQILNLVSSVTRKFGHVVFSLPVSTVEEGTLKGECHVNWPTYLSRVMLDHTKLKI